MASRTVLVVEDEPMILEIVSESMRDAGFVVIEAGDGETAISELSAGRQPISALFTDLDLGMGMDGLEVASHARRLAPALPVVYASGREEGVQDTRRVPGARFLRKPYTGSAAVAALVHMLPPIA